MHEFPHQMPNNLRLGILENYEYQENLKHSRNFGPAPSLSLPPPPSPHPSFRITLSRIKSKDCLKYSASDYSKPKHQLTHFVNYADIIQHRLK